MKSPIVLKSLLKILSANDITLDVQNLSHLQDGVDVVTHGSGHVVGRAGLAPLVDELAAGQRELGAHVGVAEGEDFAFLVDALSHDELEDAVLVLRDCQIGHGTHGGIELRQITAASLAVEHGHNLHRGLVGLRDVEVAGAAVADDADVLGEVDAVHLGQRARAADGLQDAHGHGHLHVALYGAGRVLLDEHGEGGDEHGVELAGHALCEACIMRCYHA